MINTDLPVSTIKSTGRIDLTKLVHALPNPEPTIYAYDPVTIHGRTAYLAGQIPKREGKLAYCGLVGELVTLDDAKLAARICAQQALTWLNRSAGGLENLERILCLTCFVAHVDGFTEISDVAESASDYLIESLGEIGRHSRSVIGVRSLPRSAPVLIEITAALRQ